MFHNATKPTELHARERLHARVINTSDRFSAESEVTGPRARQCPHNCTRYDTLVLQRTFANRRISIFSKKAFSAAFRPSSFLHFAILFISFSRVRPFSFSTYLYYLYKKVHDHHCPFVLLRSNKKGLGLFWLSVWLSGTASTSAKHIRFISSSIFRVRTFDSDFCGYRRSGIALPMVSIWTRAVT